MRGHGETGDCEERGRLTVGGPGLGEGEGGHSQEQSWGVWVTHS